MGRKPMTPERFQSRDVLRRLTKLEKDLIYRDAALARLKAAIRDLQETLGEHIRWWDPILRTWVDNPPPKLSQHDRSEA